MSDQRVARPVSAAPGSLDMFAPAAAASSPGVSAEATSQRASTASVQSPRGGRPRVIPGATVERLAAYLRVLTATESSAAEGVSQIFSSAELARLAGVKPAGLRRDLSLLGSYGIRGVGYDVGLLTDEIRRVLGAHRAFRVALVGVGNLGQALAGYAGFAGRGFSLAAMFDADPARIGRTVAGLVVADIADAIEICRAESISIGVIATPASAAQQVSDTLVAAGIFSILNFAPGSVSVPPGVEVRRVDLSLELQMLAFHETSRAAGVVGS